MSAGKQETLEAWSSTFLDLVAKGATGIEAATELEFNVRSVQRHASESPQFAQAYKKAKKQGREARKARRVSIEKAKPPAPKPPPFPKPPPGRVAGWLPPVSAETHLEKMQAILYDPEAPPILRKEAARQIGTFTLGPSLMRRPPREETGAEAQLPAKLGGGAPQVVLVAPDNGLYAPGCGPGAPEVVDGSEAEDAELVTLPVASGEE